MGIVIAFLSSTEGYPVSTGASFSVIFKQEATLAASRPAETIFIQENTDLPFIRGFASRDRPCLSW